MKNIMYYNYKDLIEEHLLDFLPEIDHKSITLYEAMKYSLSSGGKRIRPVLMLAACDFAGGDINSALPYACAAEYIHTYSLIHDDLPAMDNDDLRRGMPTSHKVYGDAIAILAGDGLLTSAFEAMNKDMLLYLDTPEMLNRRVRASYELAKGSGCRGMVAGQVADIEGEGTNCSKELLEYIHINKTAALLVSTIRAGAYLGGADAKTLTDLTAYGEQLGLLFQITDDILDACGNEEEMGKKTGVDVVKNKVTYVSLYGIEKAKQMAQELAEDAKKSIACYYDNAEVFNDIIDDVLTRTK